MLELYIVPSLGHHHERSGLEVSQTAVCTSRGHHTHQQRSLDEQEQKLQERLQYERYLHEKHEQERVKLEKERVERDRSKRREGVVVSSEGQKRPPSRQHRQQQQTDKHEQDKETR